MATSSISYLQTLPRDEAIAFASLLQKVKEHLNQEIQWISDQVRQKKTQLDGIETLLSEATALGLLDAEASPPSPAAAASASSTLTVADETDARRDERDNVESSATSQSPAPVETAEADSTSDTDTSKTSAPPAATTSTRQPRTGKKQATPSKTKGQTKQAATKKPSAAKARPTSLSTSAAGNSSKLTGASGAQPVLKSQFRDKSVIDAIGEILDRSKAPLDADAILERLYDSVSEQDYKRVKHSISNVLSLGKSRKRWRSAGRGVYASQT